MILRFLHGWAFDHGLWQQVLPLLPEFDCRADDRGYFDEPHPVAEGEIAVCHSFGTMRALARPAGLRALVAINGFDCFTARDGFPGIPPRVLDRMIARFAAAPEEVVSQFRSRCGTAQTPALADAAALLADLQTLREADLRAACTLPISALHAADDPIVPAAMHPALFAASPALHTATLATGGHLLPLTEPQACADFIRRALEQLG